jgi:uncharacterized protein (TIGR03435 family)
MALPRLSVLALGLGFCGVPLLPAQSAPPAKFEVASIKLNKSGPGSLQRAGFSPGDRVSFINVPLFVLIQSAYGTVDVTGPAWIGKPGQPNWDVDRFDVLAKAEDPSTQAQLQAMLRELLADRFKLVAHTETRQEPIWAIVLARRDGKLGPKLRSATVTCAELRALWKPREPGEPDPCGTRSFVNALVTGTMSVRGFTLDQLGILSMELGRRRVVDQTGLSGAFDWDLTWTPQRFVQGSFDRDRFPNVDPDGPSLTTALADQLGLKFESQKGDDTVLVIDHVEQPTPD